MLCQLSPRRTLDHPLRQLLQQPIRTRDRLRALTTGEQLIDQLVRDLLREHDPPLRIMHTQNPGRSRRAGDQARPPTGLASAIADRCGELGRELARRAAWTA